MISRDVLRGYNDTMILYILCQAPSYGYAISKQIRDISKERYLIKETTLYSAFARLEKNGYIEAFSQQEHSGKTRNYYRITAKGKAYYQEKCKEWLLAKNIISQFIAEEEK